MKMVSFIYWDRLHIIQFFRKGVGLKPFAMGGCGIVKVFSSTSRRAGPPWLSCGESHELKVCSGVETSRSAIFCASQSHYPLVNSHITMENHHFQWENPL